MWNTTETKPNPRDHIIALTADGGSALALYVHPVRGYVGSDGEVYDDDIFDQCAFWTIAPEGYNWWIERGEDGQDLDGINTEAVLADEAGGPIEIVADEAASA